MVSFDSLFSSSRFSRSSGSGTSSLLILETSSNEIKGEGKNLDKSGNIALNVNKAGKSSEIVVSKGSNTKVSGVGDVSFTMGWVEPKSKNKGTKKSKEKGEGMLIGERKDISGHEVNKGMKKGCWTRLTNRPIITSDHNMEDTDLGPKRKILMLNNLDGDLIEKENKKKIDEETRKLGSLFETYFGSAKVVKQSRQA